MPGNHCNISNPFPHEFSGNGEGGDSESSIFVSFYDSLPYGFQSLDDRGRIVHVNPAWSRMTGYGAREVDGRPFRDFLDSGSRPFFEKRFKRLLASGEVYGFEVTVVRKDGSTFDAAVTCRVGRNKSGAPDRVYCIVHDISGCVRAEQALRDSEIRYSTTLDAMVEAIHVVDREMKIVLVNETFKTWIRKLDLRGDVLGKTVNEAFPFLSAKVEKEYREVLENGKILISEECNRLDGKEVYTETRKIPIIEEGRVQKIVTVIRDITGQKLSEQKLKDSEERFRTLAEEIEDGVCLVLSGRIDWVNPAFCRLFGFDRESLIGDELDRVMESGEASRVIGNTPTADARSRGSERFECVGRRCDGQPVYLEVFSKRVFFEKTTALMIMLRDITGRRQAEILSRIREDLSVSLGSVRFVKEALREVLNAATSIDGVDCGGIYLVGAENALELAVHKGLTPDIAKAVSFYPLDTPEAKLAMRGGAIYHDRPGNIPEMRDALKRFALKAVAVLPVVDNGRVVAVMNLGSFHVDSFPAWTREVMESIVSRLGEVLRRLSIEENLHASEKKYRELYESMMDGYVRVNMEGGVEEFNQAYQEMLGYSPRELTKLTYRQLTPEKWRSYEQRIVDEQIIPNGHSEIYQKEYRRKDGTVFPVELRTYLVRDTKNQPVGMWAIVRDISHRKSMESERERILEDLAEKNKELENLMRIASHDLSAPLINITGFGNELSRNCEMLKKLVREEGISQADRVEMRRLLDADIPQCLKYIHSSTARMDQLIKGFLKISRLGRMAPKIRLLDMNRLMKDVVKSLRFLISEKNVDLEIAVLEPCRGDSIYIHQVFSNLLNNALKYLDPGRKGKIRVYSERREENTVYVVEDNGRGIDVSNLEKVFELFYREDPRGAIPGEGLGLSAVRWIVGRHWGKVWVESEAGKGSRFFVELPGE